VVELVISLKGDSPEAGEVDRLSDLYAHESSLLRSGIVPIAGVDEAGRGPLAGPLVAAAVILEPGVVISGVDDSKKLSSAKRELLFDIIQEKALSVSVSTIDVAVLDELNVLGAAQEAMRRAVSGLGGAARHVLIDGLPFCGIGLSHEFITGGDGRCHAIAAASIVAKVTRDRMMNILDRDYPGYGFSRNKGYATKGHREALAKMGVTPVHRMSFPAVRRIAGQSENGRST
jgi:ribonuclease HII